MVVPMFQLFRKTRPHRVNEERDLLIDLVGQNAYIIQYLREFHAMISTEVQKILDQARQSSSLTQSVHLGMQGLQRQVSDLTAKIDSLPAGNVLSDDDKAALQEAAGQLDNTINTLKSDIPANTQGGGSGGSGSAGAGQGADQSKQDAGSAAQGQQSGAGQGSQDQGGQQAQGDQSGQQDGGAKPLAGTGQS